MDQIKQYTLYIAAIIIHVLFIQFHIFIHYCITKYVVIGNKSQGEKKKKKNPYKKSILIMFLVLKFQNPKYYIHMYM